MTVRSRSPFDNYRITESGLWLKDTTLADVSITKHGLTPKLPNDSTKYLSGVGTWTIPPGGVTSVFAPAGPKVDPNDASWAWVNQLSATKTVGVDGSVCIASPASSSNSYNARVINPGSTPYTAIFYIDSQILALDNMSYGVMFYSTGAGKGIAMQYAIAGGSMGLYIQLGDTSHGWTGTVYHSRTAVGQSPFLMLRDDGTDRKYYVSPDGVNAVEVFSHGRTTDITADRVGFFGNPRQTSYNTRVTLFSYNTQSAAPT